MDQEDKINVSQLLSLVYVLGNRKDGEICNYLGRNRKSFATYKKNATLKLDELKEVFSWIGYSFIVVNKMDVSNTVSVSRYIKMHKKLCVSIENKETLVNYTFQIVLKK